MAQTTQNRHILYIVHGFPPRENAGTEQHCKDLALYFSQQGYRVSVIAATREIGKRQHTVYKETLGKISIWRIVNNIPARPLKQGESSPQIDAIVQKIVQNIQPDIIHFHHIQFLSSTLRFSQPTIYTLHDAWLFCPSGGTEIEIPRHTICSGPQNAKCSRCYTHWKPQPTRFGQKLIDLSEILSPFLSTNRLHQLWQLVPNTIRTRISQDRSMKNQFDEPIQDVQKRRTCMLEFANSIDVLISPSSYLAKRITDNHIKSPVVIRHGFVMPPLKHKGGNGFVFLGGFHHHKGIDILYAAYEHAKSQFPHTTKTFPELHIFGSGSPSKNNISIKGNGVIPHEHILELLRHSDALVMASRWPENAPMVIGEARSVGCPIIAPNIGGISEILQDGVDGILYTPNDIISLSEAFIRIHNGEIFDVRPPPSREEQYQKIEDLYKKQFLETPKT